MMKKDVSNAQHISSFDQRMMATAIRYSLRHSAQTASNPSVATFIVVGNGDGARIVGRGITARGGRPHAEPIALAQAGQLAQGATAYVTLEPCAHHGRTPPCANALVEAGVTRVVIATSDPDNRVSGRGIEILRQNGIEVVSNVCEKFAQRVLSGYLTHRLKSRPFITLKMALSEDGKIGLFGEGQVSITGKIARAHSHMMRAHNHMIAVGANTARLDDPHLTCRLAGLSSRSPQRLVLDQSANLSITSNLVKTARATPTLVAVTCDISSKKCQLLRDHGCQIIACDQYDGKLALPELMEDLGARSIQSLLVEGGATLGRALLHEGLVDRLSLYKGTSVLGTNALSAPVSFDSIPEGFIQTDERLLGEDLYFEYEKVN